MAPRTHLVVPALLVAGLTCALQPAARRHALSRREATSADEAGMVCTLERLYGPTSVWGDLDAAEARALYQQLLPRVLALPTRPEKMERPLTRAARKRRLSQIKYWRANRSLKGIADRARQLASRNSKTTTGIADLRSRATAAAVARQAVKKYIRGRSILPLRALTHAGDGVRTYGKTGRWRLYGESTEELVARYVSAAMARANVCNGEDCVEPEDAVKEAYAVLLEKSCCTNEYLDNLLLKTSNKALDDSLPAAERFWKDLPFRPKVLFPALEAMALQHPAWSETPIVEAPNRRPDDTDDVWNAFLLRCVEPDAPRSDAAIRECRTSGFVLAPATRARWIARAANRRAQKFRKPPVAEDYSDASFAAT